MSDQRQVGKYFKEREKIKEIMENMLRPKFKWTREVKAHFEKAWDDYWTAYDEHKELCKKKD